VGVTLYVSDRPSHVPFDAKSGFTITASDLRRICFASFSCRPLGCSSFDQMPPSRQERHKAERDASKRAPSRAGAAGAREAAAALANFNVNPLGDWTTQAEDPYVGLAEPATS